MGRDFEQNYRDLKQVSDAGADIYASRLCREILPSEPRLDLLKMQLEQERFFQHLASRPSQDLSDRRALSQAFHQAVDDYLEQWLARYDDEERQGVLLELLLSLDSGGRWTARDLATAARMPTGRLTALAVDEVEVCARRLCARGAEPDDAECTRAVGVPASASAEAAALSVASYAQYPALRRAPELIASACAAAAAAACAQRLEGEAQAVGMSAYLELLVAAGTVIQQPPGTVSAARAAGTEGVESWFQVLLALFFTNLTLLLGAAAVGLAVGAAALLANLADKPAAEQRKETGEYQDEMRGVSSPAGEMPAEQAEDAPALSEEEDEDARQWQLP